MKLHLTLFFSWNHDITVFFHSLPNFSKEWSGLTWPLMPSTPCSPVDCFLASVSRNSLQVEWSVIGASIYLSTEQREWRRWHHRARRGDLLWRQSQADDGTPCSRLKLVQEFETLAMMWCCVPFPETKITPNTVEDESPDSWGQNQEGM